MEIGKRPDFTLLLDLCFDISDYFTLTVHNFNKSITNNVLNEEKINFFQEIQPFLLKTIEAFEWGIYGRMIPLADVYIFKCEGNAKSIIQKYFDDLYLHTPDESYNIFEDLCFFKQNDMILATISHEYMCSAYPPDEEITNKFLEICEWDEYENDFNGAKYPVEDILFGADYKSHLFYMFLQCMRTHAIYITREKSLERLYYYVKGYCDKEVNTADRCMNDMLMVIDDFFPEFVRTYYDANDEPRRKHWSEIIVENNISQEGAFDKFYELLDEFLDKDWERLKEEFNFLVYN